MGMGDSFCSIFLLFSCIIHYFFNSFMLKKEKKKKNRASPLKEIFSAMPESALESTRVRVYVVFLISLLMIITLTQNVSLLSDCFCTN
jgi:hypothetical protein